VMANLVRQVGRKLAFELVSLGEPLSSGRALAAGLVNRVVPDEEVVSAAMGLAERLSKVDARALTATKRLFHEAADLPLEEALKRGRETNKRMRGFRKV